MNRHPYVSQGWQNSQYHQLTRRPLERTLDTHYSQSNRYSSTSQNFVGAVNAPRYVRVNVHAHGIGSGCGEPVPHGPIGPT